jgi:hypothetical protein
MGLLKVVKCKLDEIVPKKPKFAGRGPLLFLQDGSNGLFWSENDEGLDFWRILWVAGELELELGPNLIAWRLQSPISFFPHLRLWRKKFHMRVMMFFTCGKNFRCFGALLSNPIPA